MTGRARDGLALWGGLAIGALLAWHWYRLFVAAGCGTAACDPARFAAVLPVAVGVMLGVVLALLTRSPFPFVPLLAAPGVGALAAAGADAGGTRWYAWFGLLHLAALLAFGLLRPAGRRKRRERLARLRGEAAFAHVLDVADAGGVAYPFVRLRVRARIEPVEGRAPYEAEQVVVMPRDAAPRPGERVPVWLDPHDSDRWFPAGDRAERVLPTSARVLREVARRGAPHRRQVVRTVDSTVAALRELNADRRAGKLDDAAFARRADELLGRA